MKEISDEEFNMAFEEADDRTKELMYSSEIFDSAQKLLSSLGSEVNPNQTLQPIGYHLLDLLTEDEAISALQEVGITNTEQFLIDVKKSLTAEPDQKKENLDSEIELIEKDMGSLHTVRTMAEDVAAVSQSGEVVHQSNQENIFTKEPEDNTPRWGSET